MTVKKKKNLPYEKIRRTGDAEHAAVEERNVEGYGNFIWKM